MSKKNVLVIGSGRRVKETILPSLYCLRKHFHLAAVYSRNVKPLNLYDKWPIETCQNLDDIDFEKINVIIVAITTTAVPSVLQKLVEKQTDHISLFLDTPIFDSPRDWRYSSLFKQFFNVYATEDCFTLPSFRLFRNIIESGAIGKVRHIYIMHSGYKYHALASLKFLLNTRYILRIKRYRWNSECVELRIIFPGKIGVTLIEPRDYSIGRIMIVGDHGCIVDYQLQSEIPQNNVVCVQYELNGGKYNGISINDELVKRDHLDELFFENMNSYMKHHLVINCLKIRGFMEMLYRVDSGDKSVLYDAWDAIYDNFVVQISTKVNYFFDLPLSENKGSVVAKLLPPFGHLLPRK